MSHSHHGHIGLPGVKSGLLSFVVSAKDLPRKERGCTGPTVQDPYIKWSHRDEKNEWKAGGSTKHRINESNPEYYDSPFTFQWLHGTGQVWRFEVMDFDVLNKDDVIGTFEIGVDAYVTKNEKAFGKLEGASQGIVLINKVEMLKFKLTARDLIKLDAFQGLSDPYVECYWLLKGGSETKFAKTKTIKNVENCEWEDVVEFPIYQAGTNQHWVFKMFDKDPLPKDDVIGEAVISVDDFVRFKGIFECELSDKKGNNSKLYVTPIVN